MNPFTQLKQTTPMFLLALLLACFGLLPGARAVSPAPDGCYPNFTTAEGCNALSLLTTGAGNTGLGWFALFSAGASNFNTGVGGGALALNTGDSNTAVGAAALLLNTTGTNNTAVGTDALVFNDGGNSNAAIGTFALQSNTDGSANTAVGFQALFSNTDGISNTATGADALVFNTIGNNNTAVGFSALQSNDVGIVNTANGASALFSNTGGQGNTATGNHALFSNTTANFNTANGNSALASNTGSGNTAIGSTALANNTTGSGNIGVGNNAGANVITANSVISIGNVGKDVNNSCFISSIRGVQTQNANAIAVLIDSDGQLGTISSSRRFKKEIKPMDKVSEALLALKPVTFHYKSDATNTPQFGLIAEEVADVNPNLVVRDQNGEIYTVRYDAVNAMLLNEFLKEHGKVEEQSCKVQEQEAIIAQVKSNGAKQEATIAELKSGMEALTAMVKEQASQIQKVSAQLAAASPSGSGLGMSRPALQVAENNQ